ncbi:cytidine deaminase [Candidatus Woesearchaeota archaeon]|nr:cytidine deaminase [Candidatus Woesearchaeota archaeon]
MEDADLIKQAIESTKKARVLGTDKLGYVGAALISDKNNVFTGVSLDCYCGIGFCAEHSAIAEMVKNGETRIRKIVAATFDGTVLPPCGRCRELMFQLNKENLDTGVIVSKDKKAKLRELLPYPWQERIDVSF